MKIIAADPGISGAICIKHLDEVAVFETPVCRKKKSGKTKTYIDIARLVELLQPHLDANLFVIEDVHAMPKNGAVSMFNFGRSKGILEGIAFTMGIKVMYVAPQTWKKVWPELAVSNKDENKTKAKSSAKEQSRILAGNLHPQLKGRLSLVKADGLAEAILMAHYAEKHF